MAAEPGPAHVRRARTLAVMLGVAAVVVTADAAITCAAVLIVILTLLGVRIDGRSPAEAARGQRAPGTP